MSAISLNGALAAPLAELLRPTDQDERREFEFMVALFKSPAALGVQSAVQPRHLACAPYRELLAVILRLQEDGVRPTVSAVADELRRADRLDRLAIRGVSGFAAVAQLEGTGADVGTVPGYVRQIFERFRQREAHRLLGELAREMDSPSLSPAELAAALKRVAERVEAFGATGEFPTTARGWPVPVYITRLSREDSEINFLWDGILARGHLTLFSALMKRGKSTLLGFLLKALQTGEPFLGRPVRRCRTLIVSEESPGIWCRRRDALGLIDQHSLLCRPMLQKPNMAEWIDFCAYLAECCHERGIDLVIVDTISTFAPWRNENDAAEVVGALNVLNRLTQHGLGVLLFHHLGKVDGSEGRGARGSTALPGAVDVLLEMRSYRPDDPQDHRRVLTGLGRFEECPEEIVITLEPDGSGYTAVGDRKALAAAELEEAVRATLPDDPPGLTANELHTALPEAGRPRRSEVMTFLKTGAGKGHWQTTGTGKPRDPWRFYRTPAGSFRGD